MMVSMNTQQLVRILISRGMTQQRIAAAVGCSQTAVSMWAAGLREAGGRFYVKLMALAYDGEGA